MEPPGTEFGYNFFEEKPPVKVGEIIVEGVEIKPDPDMFFRGRSYLTTEGKINQVITSQRYQDKQYLAMASGR